MNNENSTVTKPDPTLHVREMIGGASNNLTDSLERETHRIDHDMEAETKRVDEKFSMIDTKYQIQFTAAEKAIGIASTAQEKLVAQALDGTKEAINKADVATDKRFQLLSDKITEVSDTLNKNAGVQGIYVTHTDLSSEMSKLRTDFETMLRPVITYMNTQTGKSSGIDSSWTKLATVIGLSATVITLLIKFVP